MKSQQRNYNFQSLFFLEILVLTKMVYSSQMKTWFKLQ